MTDRGRPSEVERLTGQLDDRTRERDLYLRMLDRAEQAGQRVVDAVAQVPVLGPAWEPVRDAVEHWRARVAPAVVDRAAHAERDGWGCLYARDSGLPPSLGDDNLGERHRCRCDRLWEVQEVAGFVAWQPVSGHADRPNDAAVDLARRWLAYQVERADPQHRAMAAHVAEVFDQLAKAAP